MTVIADALKIKFLNELKTELSCKAYQKILDEIIIKTLEKIAAAT